MISSILPITIFKFSTRLSGLDLLLQHIFLPPSSNAAYLIVDIPRDLSHKFIYIPIQPVLFQNTPACIFVKYLFCIWLGGAISGLLVKCSIKIFQNLERSRFKIVTLISFETNIIFIEIRFESLRRSTVQRHPTNSEVWASVHSSVG